MKKCPTHFSENADLENGGRKIALQIKGIAAWEEQIYQLELNVLSARNSEETLQNRIRFKEEETDKFDKHLKHCIYDLKSQAQLRSLAQKSQSKQLKKQLQDLQKNLASFKHKISSNSQHIDKLKKAIINYQNDEEKIEKRLSSAQVSKPQILEDRRSINTKISWYEDKIEELDSSIAEKQHSTNEIINILYQIQLSNSKHQHAIKSLTRKIHPQFTKKSSKSDKIQKLSEIEDQSLQLIRNLQDQQGKLNSSIMQLSRQLIQLEIKENAIRQNIIPAPEEPIFFTLIEQDDIARANDLQEQYNKRVYNLDQSTQSDYERLNSTISKLQESKQRVSEDLIQAKAELSKQMSEERTQRNLLERLMATQPEVAKHSDKPRILERKPITVEEVEEALKIPAGVLIREQVAREKELQKQVDNFNKQNMNIESKIESEKLKIISMSRKIITKEKKMNELQKRMETITFFVRPDENVQELRRLELLMEDEINEKKKNISKRKSCIFQRRKYINGIEMGIVKPSKRVLGDSFGNLRNLYEHILKERSKWRIMSDDSIARSYLRKWDFYLSNQF